MNHTQSIILKFLSFLFILILAIFYCTGTFADTLDDLDSGVLQREKQAADAGSQDLVKQQAAFRKDYEKYLHIRDSNFATLENKRQAWQAICNKWNVINVPAEPGTLRWDEGRVRNDTKQPFYIECFADKAVIYPGEETVTWEDLQGPDNAIEVLYDNVQTHSKDQYIVILAHPKSLKIFRKCRVIIGKGSIDIGYEALEASDTCKWNEQQRRLAVEDTIVTPGFTINVLPRAKVTDKHPVFYECRGDQVFFIDKDGLDTQVARLISSITVNPKSNDLSAYAKVINGSEIGDEYYKVIPSYLLTMVMALEPKIGTKGDTDKTIDLPSSRFQNSLRKFDSQQQYAVFLVRDDSFNIFHKVRKSAESLGFETGWELLGIDEPIKFGTGGQVIDPQ